MRLLETKVIKWKTNTYINKLIKLLHKKSDAEPWLQIGFFYFLKWNVLILSFAV